MTEDSQNRVRGHGPFPEGAEPTEQIATQNAGVPSADQTAAPTPPTHPQAPAQHCPPAPPSSPSGIHSMAHTGAQSAADAAYPAQDDANPASAPSTSATPTGPPQPGAASTSAASTSGGPYSSPTSREVDPFGLPPASFTGRRIEPSPPPNRSRLFLGIVAGLVAGLLLFGTGGWFAGRATAPKAADPTAAPSAPAPTSTLGVFEQSQVAINQPFFEGTGLTILVQGWLPYLSMCSRSGNPGGPALNAAEKIRIRCTLAGMSVFFIEYNSAADRDKAREPIVAQNADAHTLTDGVGEPFRRATESNRTFGNYAEYAYQLTEGGVTRTVAGVWWDDAKTTIAGYILAYWKDGLGEHWEPMRDLWSRYA